MHGRAPPLGAWRGCPLPELITPPDPRRTHQWTHVVVPQVKAMYPWVCHLCQQLIPTEARHPDLLAFEPDHVLPVATHPHLAYALSNLRPSHRRCNAARKDRPLTPELIAEFTMRFTAYTPPALKFFREDGR